MTKIFISYLKGIRLTSGLSQNQLAEILGISRQSLSALESGKSQPTFRVAFAIAEYFHCPIEKLFTFKESAKRYAKL
ncbi:MAG: helix-turn-helix transcriptional regulator [Patescibacteria group bacterium]|jgi:putative transcriptional regulator